MVKALAHTMRTPCEFKKIPQKFGGFFIFYILTSVLQFWYIHIFMKHWNALNIKWIDSIEHSDYKINIIQEDTWMFDIKRVEFRNQDWLLLWMIRFSITRNEWIYLTIYVKDTISAYKYRINCSQNIQEELQQRKVSEYWIPCFWKIMTEILLRYLREFYPWKNIVVNFVSLDRPKNQEAIRNMVFYVADKCSDICTSSGWWNDDNYSATIQLWLKS